MTRPFFSVVVPTRNRPDFVKETIQSVINQTFTDFEIVVSDNSSIDDNRTFETITGFNDKRISYFRVHDLSMADNWEYVSKQATGEYITLLADKRVYRNWTLERVRQALREEKVRVVSWVVDMIDDIDAGVLFFKRPRISSRNSVNRYHTTDLIKQYLYQHFSVTLNLLPRGLNSVVHHSVIDDINQSGVNSLCLPIAPDFTMAFLQLAVVDEIVHIPNPLTLSRISVGNGHAVTYKQNMQERQHFIDSSGGEEQFYGFVPIKVISAQNIVYNDFYNIRNRIGGHLTAIDLPMDTYFVNVYVDLAKSMLYGANFSEEFMQWEKTLREQPVAIQQRVRRQIRKIAWGYNLMTLGNRISLLPYQRLYRRLLKGRNSPLFTNIFDALDWEAAQVKPSI
jgi:glycosyltransferase involved in cell wall biosynthesis